MTAEPNLFAYFMLMAWPLVAAWLYATRPVGEATIWTFLGAFLLLPVGVFIKIPMIPQFDKGSIPTLCALAGCVAVLGTKFKPFFKFGLLEVVLAVSVLTPIASGVLNDNPIIAGTTVLPAVGLYDGISGAMGNLVRLLPFIIARQIFRQHADMPTLFRATVLAAIAYSALLVFEVRMSPQLHNWIYGVQTGEFIQAVRAYGYRPIAFMGHGLIASFFILTALLSAAALVHRNQGVPRAMPAAGRTWLLVVLVLCKSLGPFVLAAIAWPMMRFAKARAQVRVAFVIVLLSISYPALRMMDLVPYSSLVQLTATTISDERAQSLEFRFYHEDRLLAHALERQWFGWGRFGRSRVIDEQGVDRSVTDGHWIITLGQFGLVGYLSEFLLIVWPVSAAFAWLRLVRNEATRRDIGAMALIVAVIAINQIPNASMNAWSWLTLGALLGQLEAVRFAKNFVPRRRAVTPQVAASTP